jgi:hypothetical protein
MSTERPLDEIMSERDAPEGGMPPPPEDDRSPVMDRPRDERGRFAPRTENDDDDGSKPPSAQPDKNVPDGYVPIQAMDARLAKSEERLHALIQQNQQLMAAMQGRAQPQQPAQPAPDFFDNPDAAFDHRLQQAMGPVQQQQQAIVERFSSMMAVEKFGLEPVQEAYGALAQRVQQFGAQDPTYLRIMRSQHPYGELVRWHQEQSALSRYGSDPEAYINAEIERRMQERMQGQPGTRGPAPRFPSPMSGPTPSVGQRSSPGYAGPRPLSEIMGR